MNNQDPEDLAKALEKKLVQDLHFDTYLGTIADEELHQGYIPNKKLFLLNGMAKTKNLASLCSFLNNQVHSSRHVAGIKAAQKQQIDQQKAEHDEHVAARLKELREKKEQMQADLRQKEKQILVKQQEVEQKRHQLHNIEEQGVLGEKSKSIFIDSYCKRAQKMTKNMLQKIEQIKSNKEKCGNYVQKDIFKDLKDASANIRKLVEPQVAAGSKIVVSIGSENDIKNAVGRDILQNESLDYLVGKVCDMLQENANSTLKQQQDYEQTLQQYQSQADNDVPQQVSQNSQITNQKAQATLNIEIHGLFVDSESMLSQAQRIRQECEQKLFFGSLTAKQRAMMGHRQEAFIAHFLKQIKDQLESDVHEQHKKLDFYQSIVNKDVTEEYLTQQEAWFKRTTKFIQAYATLCFRIKQRTDSYVKQSGQALLQDLQIIPTMQAALKNQIYWLENQTITQQDKEGFLTVLQRQKYLQSKGIFDTESSGIGQQFLQQAFNSAKLQEMLLNGLLPPQISFKDKLVSINQFLNLLSRTIQDSLINEKHKKREVVIKQVNLDLLKLKADINSHKFQANLPDHQHKALDCLQLKSELIMAKATRAIDRVGKTRKEHAKWMMYQVPFLRDSQGLSMQNYLQTLFPLLI